MTPARDARYERLSTFLASRNDVELAALVNGGRAGGVGMGGESVVLDVEGVPVFAKRIPLTDLDGPLRTCSTCRCSASTASGAPGSTRGASWPRT